MELYLDILTVILIPLMLLWVIWEGMVISGFGWYVSEDFAETGHDLLYDDEAWITYDTRMLCYRGGLSHISYAPSLMCKYLIAEGEGRGLVMRHSKLCKKIDQVFEMHKVTLRANRLSMWSYDGSRHGDSTKMLTPE